MPFLESYTLPRGQVVVEPGDPIEHVYFPTEGLVSVVVNLEDGTSMEIAIIGNEGMVGASVLLEGPGATSPARRTMVQVEVRAYRLSATRLLAEFERGGKLRHWLLRYIQALITQVAQIGVCNRHHEIESQLCRWLLQRLDRLSCCDLYVTQKEIADLLGVRREGVTEAFGKLQDAGLIRCGRGHIEVLKRAGLEERVCECLAVIQKEYARLLGV